MRVETIDSWERFRALGPEWNRLVAQSRQNIPFLRYEWFETWWRHFSHRGDQPRILLLRSAEEELLAGAPLLLRRERIWGNACRVLQFMANEHSSRCGFVVHREYDLRAAVATLWEHMVTLGQWDQVRLRDLAEDEDGTLEALTHTLRAARRPYTLKGEIRSPYLQINGNWADFEPRIPGSLRRNLCSKTRKLERDIGPVKYDLATGAEQGLERRLAVGLALERASWKGRAGCAISQNEAAEGFYQDLARVAMELGWLHLGFLAAGGKPLAFVFALEYDQRLYLLKIGYDERYSRYSPGQLMRLREVADAHERNLKGYELLGAESQWKLRWTNRLRVHRTLVTYRTSARSVMPYLMDAWVMPRLRRSTMLQRLKSRWQAGSMRRRRPGKVTEEHAS